MALEATFRDLSVSLHQLLDAVNELLVGLGDTPRGEESALADGVEMKVLDLKGKLQEARKAAVLARKAVEHAGQRVIRPCAVPTGIPSLPVRAGLRIRTTLRRRA